MKISTFSQPVPIWEAAGLLNVKWPHLEKLLDEGEITFTGVGIERRIQFDDLMAYKKKWDELRRQALEEIVRRSRRVRLVRDAAPAS